MNIKTLKQQQEELEKDKPKGWANLQQQLKEVREESFKQGKWEAQRDYKLLFEEFVRKLKDKFKWEIEEKVSDVWVCNVIDKLSQEVLG